MRFDSSRDRESRLFGAGNEHRPSKPVVAGSSPAWRAKFRDCIAGEGFSDVGARTSAADDASVVTLIPASTGVYSTTFGASRLGLAVMQKQEIICINLQILRRCSEDPQMSQDEVLTLKEVAALLKIAERTAYMMVQRGDLPGFKVGGQWRFKRNDIDAWMEAQKRSDHQGREE